VFGALVLGGIETWLVHMLRHDKEFSVRHELLLMKPDVGSYEPEIRGLGIPIHRIPFATAKFRWFSRFRDLLQQEGPFDVVHCHVATHVGAPMLEVARQAEVPVRIMHCHAAPSKGDDFSVRDAVARRLAIPWLRRSATRRIGISELAIEEISGRSWPHDPGSSVLIYGFDFSAFSGAPERAKAIRKTLSIPRDSLIVGHVGRFASQKNHGFLLKAFAVCARNEPRARLVLVGEGPLQSSMEELARTLGIDERVHFAGTTHDVPAYMAMFDLFVLPSFHEGLGIVCVEAQAAGTPAIVSDTTPAEASVVPCAVEFLPLAEGADAWGKAMAARLRQPKPKQRDWQETVEKSQFGIRRCINDLDAIYRSELNRSKK